MEPVASVRMTANLNALTTGRIGVSRAAAAVQGVDVAHHVLDPQAVLDLDPLAATDLPAGLAALAAVEHEGWALGLPAPGALAPLRGPRGLNEAALAAGEVVLAQTAGVGLVPLRVGRAVQWRIYPAERPLAAPTPYEAERALNEVVLAAGRVLSQLDVAGGARPAETGHVVLAPGYSSRSLALASRALSMLTACDAALVNDGSSISSFEAEARLRALRELRAAANAALVTACTWTGSG